MNELAIIPSNNAEIYRASTDAAGLCRSIVVETAMQIGDRKYVKVEGWQAIAVAHGCTASARDVRKVDGGVSAIGEIRRMSDGAVIAEAEGFVGEDEPTWYGGVVEKEEWTGPKGSRRKTGTLISQTLPKRADYAIRAMAQTRAISRACRSAFAHVVVMMNAGLSTTPAEEVPEGGFDNQREPEAHGPPEAEVLAITAARSAFIMAEGREALKAWRKDNAETIKTYSADTQDRIAVDFNQRWEALAPDAPAAEPTKPSPSFTDDEIPF